MTALTAEQYVTLAEAAALVVTVLAIACTAFWRRTLTPWWARFTWTPRLTPGIRAEVIMVMSEDGLVGVQFEKLAPEDSASEVIALFTQQWFTVGESMGISLHWTSRVWQIIDTPDGPTCVVPLMQPKKPKLRAFTDAEARAMQGEGGGAA